MLAKQGDVASDWIISDADKEVLSLECPADLRSVKEEEIVVWVDPLDGTSEYTQGNTMLQYLKYKTRWGDSATTLKILLIYQIQ